MRDYALHLKATKSLTPSIYEDVGEIFRSRFGQKAGWAHSVLFAAELPEFRRLLPDSMQDEMKTYLEDKKKEKLKSPGMSPEGK